MIMLPLMALMIILICWQMSACGLGVWIDLVVPCGLMLVV